MKFTEILSHFHIEYKTEGHHHCRDGWVNIDCPFCGKNSHKWHLGYNIEKRYLNCWRCGSHSLIETLMVLTNLSFSKCKELLDPLEKEEVRRRKEYKGKLILPEGIGFLQEPHLKYLLSRGFNTRKLRDLWRIQGIGLSARLMWRIFIPIIQNQKVVSWTTRSISNEKGIVRYINASIKEEATPHKTLLYGEDYTTDTIIVTEGPIDVWRIGPGAVSTMGSGYSQSQVEKMSVYKTRVVCFDNEKEAQKRARNLCNDLSMFPGSTHNIILDSKDAAEASKEEIKKIRQAFL